MTPPSAAVVAPGADPLSRAFHLVVERLFARDAPDPRAAWEALLELLPSTSPASPPPATSAALLRARERLEAAPGSEPSIEALARGAGLQRRSFERAFRRAFHLSPHAWRLNAKVEAAKAALRTGLSVADAATQCGYADARQFSRHYRRLTGLTARAYAARFRIAAPDRNRA